MIKSLLPMCLSHNPNWVYFYNATDYLWQQHVINNIPVISQADLTVDLNASREDILLRASRIGWTFADNFSANWQDDERAERFLKRFIESWIPYCRNYAGTKSLAPYMGYLLGMEIRIVQLWSNTTDEWDTKPIPKLISMNATTLPDDYLVKSKDEDPFLEPVDLQTLRSEADLNNNVPDWKTIDEDPINGWYPTSHFDVYVDLDQVPKSDLQEKTAEEIIAGLFYELADIYQVLRAIVYSYNFTQIVRISSGQSIVERIEASKWQMPILEWSGWIINPTVNVVGTVATYLGTNTNTQITYESTAQIDLGNAILKSLSDSDMQQWQGAKDAIGQLTGGATEWAFDNANSRIQYTPTEQKACASFAECSGYEYLWTSNTSRIYTTSDCIAEIGVSGWWGETKTVFTSPTAVECQGTSASGARAYLERVLNPNYDPSAAAPTVSITYQQVVDKIIANSNAVDQGISLLAQAYMQEVAKSIFNPSPAKQFVTMADIESILELNKRLV